MNRFCSIFICVYLLYIGVANYTCAYAFPPELQAHINPIETENQFYEYKLFYENLDSTSAKEDLPHLLKLFAASKALGIDSLAFGYGYDIGDIYYGLDSLTLAFEYAHEAYYYAKNVKDKNEVGHLVNFLGLINSIMGDYESALGYFFESVDIFKKNDERMMVYALGNISEVYYTLKDIDKALEYTKEATVYSKMLEGNDYYYNYGFDCIRLADWNLQKGHIDSANHYLRFSIAMADSIKEDIDYYKEFKFYVHENATKHYIKLENLKKAKEHLEIAETNMLVFLKGNYALLKGEYLFATNQQNELKALMSSVDINQLDSDLIEDWLRLEIKSIEKSGYMDQVGPKYKQLEKLIEEKYSEQRNHFTVIANARYETLKKEEQITLLQKQNEVDRAQIGIYRVRMISIALLFFSVLMILGFLSFYYRKKKQYSILLEQEVSRKTEFLNELNESLSNKNEELKQFNYIIAHDLKEPVRSIVSFSELLKIFRSDEEKVDEYCNMIINSGKQLHTLVNDIQEFQTLDIEESAMEEFEVNSLIEEVQNSLSSFLKEKNATISCGELPKIKSSRAMLFVVFKNLIENGLKYNRSDQPKVEISAQYDTNKWLFNFKDNGIGISKQFYDEVFVMFKRLHNRSSFKGTGIGLALSQKIAKRLNGEISIVHSEEGVGTQFQLSVRS